MWLCHSREVTEELKSFRELDRDIGIALEACIDMLRLEANEFEGQDGFSIKRVGGFFRRGIRVYRVKYERYIPGIRILFFSIPEKDCVFVSGAHRRSDLGVGMGYDFSREAFARAQRYWGMRSRLC